MKGEHIIVSQVLAAQRNRQAADDLIEQYMPFIKNQAARAMGRYPTESDDELSIAMFGFYEAMMAYQPDKGSFLKLAELAIKNRLVDHHRKERRHYGHISLDAADSHEDDTPLGHRIPAAGWHSEASHDQWDAQREIQHFAQQLAGFSISLTEVAENCPKQDRTLRACMRVLDYARRNPKLLEQLAVTGKLPITNLHQGSGVDKKTLERHRKYLIAILLAYTNGFEIIRGHLRLVKGRGEHPNEISGNGVPSGLCGGAGRAGSISSGCQSGICGRTACGECYAPARGGK